MEVKATTDSVIQIGSSTRPWTMTLVVQLADEGLIGGHDGTRTQAPHEEERR